MKGEVYFFDSQRKRKSDQDRRNGHLHRLCGDLQVLLGHAAPVRRIGYERRLRRHFYRFSGLPVRTGCTAASPRPISDLLGVIIKPSGPYNPIFTITAFCGGVIKGWIWRLLAMRNDGRVRRVALCLLIALGVVGGAFHISLVSDGISAGLAADASELPKRSEIQMEDYNPLTKLVVRILPIITTTSSPIPATPATRTRSRFRPRSSIPTATPSA